MCHLLFAVTDPLSVLPNYCFTLITICWYLLRTGCLFIPIPILAPYCRIFGLSYTFFVGDCRVLFVITRILFLTAHCLLSIFVIINICCFVTIACYFYNHMVFIYRPLVARWYRSVLLLLYIFCSLLPICCLRVRLLPFSTKLLPCVDYFLIGGTDVYFLLPIFASCCQLLDSCYWFLVFRNKWLYC